MTLIGFATALCFGKGRKSQKIAEAIDVRRINNMKNLKSYVFLLALCLLCGQGYATVRMFVAPEGKRLFICEYTNASPNKVEIPRFFMENDNNIIYENLCENHQEVPVGPLVDYMSMPPQICIDAYKSITFTSSRDGISFFFAFRESLY